MHSGDFFSALEFAQGGSPFHQLDVAKMYFDGHEVPKSESEAFRWFLAAALQGESEGMYWVGLCYLRGLGIEHNKFEAIKWLHRLAEPETTEDCGWPRRMVDAQVLMAAAYHSVPGEPSDAVFAYAWALLAKCYGKSDECEETQFNAGLLVAERDAEAWLHAYVAQIEASLTPEQRVRGQLLAADMFRSKDDLENRRDAISIRNREIRD